MTAKKAKKILEYLKQKYGKIETELSYSNLYQLTISVILSAQTTDRQVNTVTPDLFKRYKDFDRLAAARVSEVEKIIKSVGLYKTKAKNIVGLSREIMSKYNGKLPRTREELMTLPGIGRKSANVILSFGMKKDAFPVDTHVKRIARRIGFRQSDDPYEIEMALTHYIPEKEWRSAHLLLINHGRKTCMARNPKCAECPINLLCGKNGVQDNIS
ncbi:MAG: endonuclease III [Spirochaetes bacterium]|nr:endonuclease III [Spirochaetota bacterium]